MDKLLESYLKLTPIDYSIMRFFVGRGLFGFNENVRGAELFKSTMTYGSVFEPFSHAFMVNEANRLIDGYLKEVDNAPHNKSIHENLGFDVFASFLLAERRKVEVNFVMWRNSTLCFCDLLLLIARGVSGNDAGAERVIKHITTNYISYEKDLFLKNSGVFMYVRDTLNTYSRAKQYNYRNAKLAETIGSLGRILRVYADFFVHSDLEIGHELVDSDQKYSIILVFKNIQDEIKNINALVEISRTGEFDPLVPALKVCYSKIKDKISLPQCLSKFENATSLLCDANALICNYFTLYRKVISSFLDNSFDGDRKNSTVEIKFDEYRISNVVKKEHLNSINAVFADLENEFFKNLEQLKVPYI